MIYFNIGISRALCPRLTIHITETKLVTVEAHLERQSAKNVDKTATGLTSAKTKLHKTTYQGRPPHNYYTSLN